MICQIFSFLFLYFLSFIHIMTYISYKHILMQGFSEAQLQKLKDFFHMKETPEEREIFLMEKTKKYSKLLSYVPWILLVWVGNSVAMNTAHKDSDIDLFIITQENRIWTVRILTTFLIGIMGQRKTAHEHKDKFCLSFFVTKKAMDFSEFALKNDIYLYFWVLYMKPIIDFNNTYDAFLEANRSWINMDEYTDITNENKTYSSLSWDKKESSSKIWDMIEAFFKKLFLPKTLKHYEELWKPYGIIIWDDILKFHDNDLRKKIREKIFS